MQLYCFLPFLILLAGFLVGTRAQNPECGIEYGVNLSEEDCMRSIYDLFEILVPDVTSFHSQGLFSRQRSISNLGTTLPQARPYQTCSVGIDVANPAGPPVRAIFRTVWRSLTDLYHTCVRGPHLGGSLERDGLVYVVVHTASLVGQGTCLVPETPPIENLAQCVALKVHAMQRAYAAQSAPQGGSASALTPPSLPPQPGLRSQPQFLPSSMQTDMLSEFDTIQPLLLQASQNRIPLQEQLAAMGIPDPEPSPTTSFPETTSLSRTSMTTASSTSRKRKIKVTEY